MNAKPVGVSADLVAAPAAYFRGGTSKALLMRGADLPAPAGPALDDWIRAVLGSPDPRQIDGIGGADLLTSKFAVVDRSAGDPDADVDYRFFQVGVDTTTVATDASCGNIAGAVAVFAVEEGLVPRSVPVTRVRIRDLNTGMVIVGEVPVGEQGVITSGDTVLDGVPGTGAPVWLDFAAAAGSSTGALLPTGRPRDQLVVEGVGALTVSVVDVSSPVVFVRAADLGLRGTEPPSVLQGDAALLATLERIRGTAAALLGWCDDWSEAVELAPGLPFLALVAPGTAGAHVTVRGYAMGTVHRAYWATGGVCTAVAARLPGTVVEQEAGPAAAWAGRAAGEGGTALVRIGHPAGALTARVALGRDDSGRHDIRTAALVRTARRIMDGTVYAPATRLPWLTPPP